MKNLSARNKFEQAIVSVLIVLLLAPGIALAATSEGPAVSDSAASKTVSKKTSAKKIVSTKNSQAKKSVLKPKRSSVSNDVTFDGSIVKGHYQVADGSTTTVENEKALNGLIEPRKDFKDRMRAERNRP